ncbi:DNA-binding protein [candidate division KSB1 bacterium]|nr:DNA-binding protein [candidate division KSB1 bacterium]
MKAEKPVIVDTNILFSSLLHHETSFFELLLGGDYAFYICEMNIVELSKRNDKIIELSELSDEITKFFYQLLKRINIFKEDLINESNWNKAIQLCKAIDESDTPFVALTLELEGLLLSGDRKLKVGLMKKGFDLFFEYSNKG